MKRIAVLGCENSHANAFLGFIKEKEEFADVEVVGVYSDEREAAEKLHDTFGVAVLDSFDDAVGNIDGLIITARHGKNHFKYAEPYIKSGVPMFIDKPFTVDGDEALAFAKLLKENGIRITGGSSLKHDVNVLALKAEHEQRADGETLGGFVRAPYQSENAYGGFYFYSQHLVEIVLEIFGRFPLAVSACKNGTNISVVFHYEAYDVSGLYTDGSYKYFAARMSQGGSSSRVITSTKDWFYKEFSEFYEILSGGEQKAPYEEFVSPVLVMNAIERAVESGKREPVAKICI